MISSASPILALMMTKGVGAKTLSDFVDELHSIEASIDELDINLISDRLGWKSSFRDSVLKVLEQSLALTLELDSLGVRILVRGYPGYPSRLSRLLGSKAPPVLFAIGNPRLLETPSVGFSGSRNASEKGLHIAREAATQLGKRGVNIVSGYAKGVDLNAHVAALLSGGTTTIVLAEGITHFRAKSEIKRLLTADNYVVISEFLPLIPWASRQAMQRNQTIIGLTDAMIVVESGETGGTFACGESTLQLNHPLYVVEYASAPESAAGNSYFLTKGAHPIRGDKSGQPNLSQLLNIVMGDGATTKASTSESKPKQTEIDPDSSPKEKPNDTSTHETTPAYQKSEPQLTHAKYPKRLIEVDLPIARISAHARREKSIRHGHISTLHIWWARRPLAACRAVICASLWPDPADELCPQAFRNAAVEQIKAFANRVFPKRISAEGHLLSSTKHSSPKSLARWQAIANESLVLNANEPASMPVLRTALLDFIADFANWDNSNSAAFLDTSRALTDAAHLSLGGLPGTRPLVVDPFAGGGSIPLEALRIGADAFASDINPLPVLLNKVLLEFIPKYGQRLSQQVAKWGKWVKDAAEKELSCFYPQDSDGATPIAYMWARTILCEGPNCGAEIPLIGQTWLSTKEGRKRAFTVAKDSKSRRIEIAVKKSPKENDVMTAISKRSTVTCPLCGYTTPANRVREILSTKLGGSDSARLVAVVTTHPRRPGKEYREPNSDDIRALENCAVRMEKLEQETINGLPAIPHEHAPPDGALGFRFQKYGIRRWRDLYTHRQLIALTTFSQIVSSQVLRDAMSKDDLTIGEQDAVLTCLALAIGRVNDLSSSLCRWLPSLEAVAASNGSQNKMPMILDFVEVNPLGGAGGDWSGQIDWIERVIRHLSDSCLHAGNVTRSPAQETFLPDDIASAMVTDPPYYSAFGYSDLSEFFFPWLRRSAPPSVLNYEDDYVPKAEEAISIGKTLSDGRGEKNDKTYLASMSASFEASRRVVRPDGIGVVVFANKTTAGWEAILDAMISAGWMVSASWPIDTERPNRQRAIGSAALQSSVHLVCRPREDATGAVKEIVGEWRDVLGELPIKIHEWMPRLAAEGVVGADAIFACLGPALEIFSRYSTVEKSNGELATLREYLEFVWGAVSTEALSLIFNDADASGLEPDSRLTAMWLWTIGGGSTTSDTPIKTLDYEGDEYVSHVEDDEESDSTNGGKFKATGGFILAYDAARKISQGLGIHLEQSHSLIEVSKDKARLLPVVERTQYLFGKNVVGSSSNRRPSKKLKQKTLFDDLDEAEAAEEGWTTLKGPPPGSTTLDRVHQAMILFAANRGELLKRFLVEDGVGKDPRFWKLADNLNKLYPTGTDERRWVEGVLARKKGLGF
jgi:putative DNA methylase